MPHKYALLIDTETTGLDPKVHRCVEVACCLFDLELAVPLFSYASLVASPSNEAEAVNGIPARVLSAIAWMPDPWGTVQFFAENVADVILAHRADFDRSFVPGPIADAKPWVCTKFHVDWPNGKPGDSLVSLALAHGVGVVSAHRAMADVDILSRLLMRVHEMGHPLVPLLVRAMRPRVKLIAQVSYDDRDKAKSAGFAWDPDARQWWREMPVDEAGTLPFPTRAA